MVSLFKELSWLNRTKIDAGGTFSDKVFEEGLHLSPSLLVHYWFDIASMPL